jgi:AbrB family looped-hinge helix DNA binding protein
MKTIVSERGQITLPKAIRVGLGIRPGTIIDFVVENGEIIGRKKESDDPIRKWRGKGRLPDGFSSVDEYLSAIRG